MLTIIALWLVVALGLCTIVRSRRWRWRVHDSALLNFVFWFGWFSSAAVATVFTIYHFIWGQTLPEVSKKLLPWMLIGGFVTGLIVAIWPSIKNKITK